jgi:hypothetical protein
MGILLLKLGNLELSQLILEEVLPIFVEVVSRGVVGLCKLALVTEVLAKGKFGHQL